MKRGMEEEEPNPGEDESVTPPPNQFGDWLIANIYKYAKVRDSDELAQLKAEHEVLQKHCDKLLHFAREVVIDSDFAVYPQFCGDCGSTRVKEAREVCGRCRDAYVSCWFCVPRHCKSLRHRLCFDCINDEFEDHDDIVCNGIHPDKCVFEE
jgi:hypothetical protein